MIYTSAWIIELLTEWSSKMAILYLIIKIMNQIKNIKKFNRMNIHDIFHRMHITKDDEWKTIFHTHYDHYEYLIMLFDLLYNTPAIFQFYINDVLHDFLNNFYVIYLNDVFIYIDNTHEEYIQHVHQILQRLEPLLQRTFTKIVDL